MDRKIGNYVILFLSLCTVYSFPSLELVLTDMQGNRLNQVEVEVPFLLRVIVKNIDTQEMPQGVKAWSNFQSNFYGKEQSMTSINGRMSNSTTFNFVLKASSKGTFRCPGLVIEDRSGKQYQSEDITITVADDVVVVHHNNSAQPFVLIPEIDQKIVYIGQKIMLRMRFGYQEEFEDLHIQTPQMSDFMVGYMSNQPTSGTMKVAGNQYNTHDFIMELYPEKVGNLVIPSFQAIFATNRFNFATLMTAAMLLSGKDSVSSTAKSITVQPLPQSNEFVEVTAIGQFQSATLQSSVSQAKVGEGIVLSCKIQGIGNLQIVKAPALQLPEGLHYYEGNSTLTRMPDGSEIKSFEWIVQADRPGDFIIDAQMFAYFDNRDHMYKKLHTAPLALHVTGQAITDKKSEVKKQIKEKDDASIQVHESDIAVVDIYRSPSIAWFYNPLGMFGTMCNIIISVLFVLLSFLMVARLIYALRVKMFFLQSIPFRIRFFKACRNQDLLEIYNVFESLLQQYELDFQSFALQDCFDRLNMPKDAYQNWKNFIEMLCQINFSNDNKNNVEDVALAISLAKQWFTVIVSCCKISFKNNSVIND